MGRGPLAGKGPWGFNSGSWDIDLTGIAVRAAYSNPAAFGETIGPERLVNSDFAAGDASWAVLNADGTHIATFSGGTVRYQSDTTSPVLSVRQTNALIVGRVYQITVIVSSYTSGSIKTDNFGLPVVLATGAGTFTAVGTASATTFEFLRNSTNVDLTVDSISVREITTGWLLPGLSAARLSADSMTGPRLVRVQDGSYQWAPHNLLLNSATLSTQSLTVVVGQVLTIAATGTGTVTLSNAATGTLNASSARPSLTVTATTTTLTCTVSGTVTQAQVNRGAAALAYVPTAGAARYAPPVEHDGVAWGVRGEAAGTNLLTHSQEIENAAWTKTVVTVPVTNAAALDGSTTARRVRATGSTGIPRWTISTAATTNGVVYTASAFVAPNPHTFVQVHINNQAADWVNFTLTGVGSVNNNGAATGQIVALASGWYRIAVTYTAGSTDRAPSFMLAPSGTATRAQSWTPADTDAVLFWNAQFETGPIATSPIPTFGAAVTRTIDAIDASTATRTKGLIVVDYVPREAGSQQIASIDDATTNERHLLTNDGIYAVTDGGAAQASVDGGTPNVGALNRVAATWNTNRFAVSLNGGAAAADASGTVPTVNRIRIASGLNGGVRALRVGAQDVTDAALVSRARV